MWTKLKYAMGNITLLYIYNNLSLCMLYIYIRTHITWTCLLVLYIIDQYTCSLKCNVKFPFMFTQRSDLSSCHKLCKKKLQMDPLASDPLLQKTSPTQDPAAVSQLTTEVSAQASMLAAHHHQLQRLTSLTEELSKTLQALCNIAAPPSPTPPPAALSQSASRSITSPRLSFPEKYDGTPNKCKGFLLQCTIFMDQQPHLYPTDDSRVPFVCSLLTGRALDWATAVWEGGNMAFPSFRNFMHQFREVFEHAVDGKEVGEQLLALRHNQHGGWLCTHLSYSRCTNRLG